MLLYILKFSACLAVLLLFYKLFLERENMHVFKRFYLLGALAFSLIVPQLVFTEYLALEPVPEVVMEPTTDTVVQPMVQSTDVIGVPPALETDIVDIAPLLWGIYFLGLIFFGLNFIKNLVQVYQRIKNNPKERKDPFVRVLLRETFPPHTFFNYIFLNRVKLESNKIPQEVLLHEETHAKQKHSLDVLFIELLQVAMWFNPLVYFARKSIKLNHEFLADSEVLKKGMDSSTYQNTLLSFMVPKNQNQPLANAINYSSIKKRFTVMKTQTSKKSILFRSLLILPIIATLLFGFSETKRVEFKNTDSYLGVDGQEPSKDINDPISNIEKRTTDDFVQDVFQNESYIEIMVNKNGQLLVRSELVEVQDLSSYLLKLDNHPSKEIREKTVRAVIVSDKSAPQNVLDKIAKKLEDYGVAQIDIRGSESMPSPVQNVATKEQLSKYNTLAKKYNAQPKEKRVIPSEDLKSLESIYRKMSKKQKAAAQPFPECPDPKSNQQKGITDKQMAEYSTLAKKYNVMLADDNYIRIKKTEVDRLEYLYSLMTEEQRENAEPFPDFPEPPEPPAPPSLPEDKSEKEIADELIEEIIAYQDLYDVVGGNVLPTNPPKVKTYFDMEDEDVTIYRDGEEISHLEMNRMQQAGEIATINVSKNTEGQKIIRITDLKTKIQSSPPSSPNRMESKNAGVWTVTSGANRDTRNIQDSAPIPSVTPTIGLHADRSNYSKELKNSINAYLEGNKKFEKAVADYREKGKGNSQNLWSLYNEAMEKYVAYHILAKEEGNFVQPVPAYKERIEVKNNISITPPAPPKPKAPLDYVIEMAKKDARFYFEGKEISPDKAIKLMKKNKNLNIDSRRDKGKKPIIKLSTEPIVID